jgi:hypothetical protein
VEGEWIYWKRHRSGIRRRPEGEQNRIKPGKGRFLRKQYVVKYEAKLKFWREAVSNGDATAVEVRLYPWAFYRLTTACALTSFSHLSLCNCSKLPIFFGTFYTWDGRLFLFLCFSLTENLDQSGEVGFISEIDCPVPPFSWCNSACSLGKFKKWEDSAADCVSARTAWPDLTLRCVAQWQP